VKIGDFEGAFARAAVKVDQTYTTPDQSHCMMEPHATIAAWKGDELTLWSAQQIVGWARRDLSNKIGVPQDKIRIVASYIGGGFGGKGSVCSDAALAALGARAAGRPVKVALQRPLMPNNTTHRPATIQRVRLGADRDGRLVAVGHESLSGNLPGGGPGNRGRADPAALCRGQPAEHDALWRAWTCQRATPCARRARPPA
jgi:xanthine dehydrogenase YagR molybdenum-binding subunit